MQKSCRVTLCLLIMLVAPALWADNGARPGSTLGGPDPIAEAPAGPATILEENFDDILLLPGLGWVEQNNSDIAGSTTYFQGNDTVFPSHVGAPTAYLGVNFNSTAGTVISNWMMTPEIDFDMAGDLHFFARATDGNTFPDRLEVRVSTNGASTDVGAATTDVGDFTNLVVEINPNLDVGGFPQVYTEFTADLSAFAGSTGRVAFRYWVTDAGPTGNNSNYIGIDTVSIDESINVPPPNPIEVPTLSQAGAAALVLLMAGLAIVLIRRR